MTYVCPKCGRPIGKLTRTRGEVGVCTSPHSYECAVAAAAYRRGRRDGIDEGVQIAKEGTDADS